MSRISRGTLIRIDEVNWEDWKKAEDMLSSNDIWFTTSNNEEGYNLIDCEGESPYEILQECGILDNEQVDIIKITAPEKLLIVFK